MTPVDTTSDCSRPVPTGISLEPLLASYTTGIRLEPLRVSNLTPSHAYRGIRLEPLRVSNLTPSRKTRAGIAALLCAIAQVAAAQSLYDEATFQSLTSDRRALKPGDAITVLVMENSSASATANTTTQKTGGITAGLKGNSISHTGSITLGEDFGGKGTVQRAGRVAAQLTVTVHSVAPNDELFIRGKQNLLVNGEKQLIELSGRVRPIDISETNTVLSTRIADANITYVGDGVLAEKQKQGVLSHILGWLGLL